MSPEIVRAARNWLGWTQQELASKSHLGLSTIKDFEAGKRWPHFNNIEAIKIALINAGLTIADDAVSGPVTKQEPEGGASKPQSPA